MGQRGGARRSTERAERRHAPRASTGTQAGPEGSPVVLARGQHLAAGVGAEHGRVDHLHATHARVWGLVAPPQPLPVRAAPKPTASGLGPPASSPPTSDPHARPARGSPEGAPSPAPGTAPPQPPPPQPPPLPPRPSALAVATWPGPPPPHRCWRPHLPQPPCPAPFAWARHCPRPTRWAPGPPLPLPPWLTRLVQGGRPRPPLRACAGQ